MSMLHVLDQVRLLLSLLLMAAASSPAATPPGAGVGASAVRLRSGGVDALESARWETAALFLERSLVIDRNHPDALFHLSICAAQLDRHEAGLGHLKSALRYGFKDYRRLDTDSRLNSLRSHPEFPALRAAARERLEAFDADMEAGIRESYKDSPLRVQRLQSPRLILITDLDEKVSGHLREMLAQIEAGHCETLFPNGLRHAIAVHAVGKPPASADSPPLPPAYRPPATTSFSAGSRTLQISIDSTPGAIQREMARALHVDDQAAHGQLHAPWLQVAIPALYEQAASRQDGVTGLKCWRLPGLKARAARPGFRPLERLLSLEGSQFDDAAAAEARYLLYWLQSTGRLGSFYREYVRRFDEDPTGRAALEGATGKPLARLERDWIAFLKSTSPVP